MWQVSLIFVYETRFYYILYFLLLMMTFFTQPISSLIFSKETRTLVSFHFHHASLSDRMHRHHKLHDTL